MKILLALCLFSLPAIAADDTPPQVQKAHIIQGQCEIVQNDKNPFPGPCADISLILETLDGKEFLRTRASHEGIFSFAFDEAGSYKINSGTKFYELDKPSSALHGGESILVKLRRK